MPDELARLRGEVVPAAVGRAATRGIVTVLVAVAAILVLGMLLEVAGFSAPSGLGALWRGSFGSVDAVVSATLVRATPLMLIGAGMVLALRSGVVNVGGDGQLLAGATGAIVVATAISPGPVAMVAALGASAVAGALWSLGPAWLKATFGTLEVVSTIMMNFLAVYAVGYLVRGPLQEPSGLYPQSGNVPDESRLPLLIDGSRLHAGFLLGLACAVGVWILLEQTAAGLRMRAVGSNPAAARLAGGIGVTAVQARAFLASGALAGVAGGVEVLGVTFALYENLSPGYGYTAIAVALLARLGALRAIWSAILLGALAAGATAMQRDAGVPAGAAAAVEAAIVLSILGTYALPGRRYGVSRILGGR